MALQDKKIMPPPWLAHREIERYSIGWRMGYGEDYIYRFGDWLDTLSPEERTEYRNLFPEPVTWKGWWDDEDNGEVLEDGDFFVEVWQPEGRPKYTRQWLQQEFSAERTRELCLFGAISLPRMAVSQKAASASGGWRTSGPSPTPISAWSSI